MRKIDVTKVSDAISRLCIKANLNLRSDIERALRRALKKEVKPLAKRILRVLLENAKIAERDRRPLCQDTGIVSVYLRVGQNIQFVGGELKKAVERGVRKGYEKGILRKSVVKSPLIRINTSTNTPPVIYTDIVRGDRLKITVVPKGFGSENKSAIKMFGPTATEKDIASFIVDVVKKAGPDACPPYILGIGIGGTFDKAASLAKKALLVPLDRHNIKKHLRNLEKIILKEANALGIGPLGLGGKTTCLGANILEYPTHIAGLPVAVNVGCHITRNASCIV
ncbi:MAG: fumarate hydratase [Candidatus Omnitrophica bacterium]|nr:fumarate hydratase [Candidatus Omnitrophota bacterium]